MQRYAILLMAGQSRRFGGGDKCLAALGDQPIAFHGLEAFRSAGNCDRYLIVHRGEAQKKCFENFIKKYYSAEERAKISWITGGPERMFSVFNALQFIHSQLHGHSFVFIHDGARPMITAEHILAIDALLSPEWGIALGHRVTDTIVAAAPENRPQTASPGIISAAHPPPSTLPAHRRRYLQRDALWALETPQAFYFPAIFEDYGTAIHSQRHCTDDSSVFRGTMKILQNNYPNLKITAPEDGEFCQKLFE
jgi:2-C-methyl-D-erythritol 4-phosphate cytidylyltransferase